MKLSPRLGWFAVILALSMARSASCQDIYWTQPYNGNIVYGPLTPSPGPLPNCPECQCPTCQPGGVKGCIKRFFGGICKKFHTCRRENYYWNEMYHTGYSDPVFPPYCEPGYGYYETAWRRPTVPPIPCELLPECNPTIPTDLEAPIPEVPSPAVSPESAENSLPPGEGIRPGRRPRPIPQPVDPAGYEKPPCEGPPQASTSPFPWNQASPVSIKPGVEPLIRPRY